MTVTMLSGHSQPLALHPDSSLWAVVLALLTEVGLQLGEGPQASPTRSPEGKRLSDTGPSEREVKVPTACRAMPGCPGASGSSSADCQAPRWPRPGPPDIQLDHRWPCCVPVPAEVSVPASRQDVNWSRARVARLSPPTQMPSKLPAFFTAFLILVKLC